MHRTTLAILAALPLLGLVACGDDDGGATVTVSVQVTDGRRTGNPVPDVEACVLDHPEVACVTSRADGWIDLPGVPASTDVAFTAWTDTFFPAVVTYHTTTEDHQVEGPMAMVSEIETQVLLALIGEDIQPDKGHVSVFLYDAPSIVDASNVPEATLDLSISAGGRRMFVNVEGQPDTELTATTTGGGGGFMNVEPGTWVLTVAHPTLTCRALYAWGGPDTFRVPVEPGALTVVHLACD